MLLQFIALCGFLAVSRAQLNAHLNSEFIEAINNHAVESLRSPQSLKQSYFATKILARSGPNNSACNCGAIGEFSAIDNMDIFYGANALKFCNCAVSTTYKMFQISKDDLREVCGEALASSVLGTPMSTKDVVDNIKPFMQADGLFKDSLHSSEKFSLDNTNLALLALSEYATNSETRALMTPFVPMGDDESQVDPTLLSYLVKLSEKDLKLKSSRLLDIGHSLIALAKSKCMSTQANALWAIDAFRTFKSQPLHIFPSVKLIDLGSKSNVLPMFVVDILGQAVTAGVEVKNLQKIGKESNVSPATVSGTTVDFSSSQLTPGRYQMQVSALSTTFNTATASVTFLAQDSLVLSDMMTGITDSKQASNSELQTVKTQNSVKDLTGAAQSNSVVHIAFALATKHASSKRFLKPHQVFVKFSHVETGHSAFFVAKSAGAVDNGQGAKYQAAVSLSTEIEQFAHKSGDYVVSALVSDVMYSNPLEWIIGTMSLDFPAKIVKEHALYAHSLLHASDHTLAAMPEIVHQMRPPAKRASAFMSRSFTALVAVPLLGFVLYALKVAATSKAVAANRIGKMLFVLAIGAVLGLYVSYWLSLPGFSFYATIKYLFIILPVALFVGRGISGAAVAKQNKA